MNKQIIRTLTLILGLQPFVASAEYLSAAAEILIWQASEQTASSWANIVQAPDSSTLVFTPIETNFGYDNGVRLKLQYHADTWWDSALYWTHFDTTVSGESPVQAQVIAPGFFSSFVSGNIFFGALVDWNLRMNMFDYNLSHEFKVGDSLTLRPALGVKAGGIDQSMNMRWLAVIFTADELQTIRYKGIGPSFGLDTKWQIYKNLSFLGDFSTAFLWGNWKISDTYNRPEALFGVVTPTTINTGLNNSKLGTMMFDYFLGLELILQDRVTLKLGYEMQFWPNQFRLLTFQQLPVHGDLTLQGATCGIQLDF